MECEVIEFNNKNYYLVKKLNLNNNIYCYFVNVNNKYDVFVRKLIKVNDNEYLVSLDDENELFFALSKFKVE